MGQIFESLVANSSGESDVNMLINIKDDKVDTYVENKWELVDEIGVDKEKEKENFKPPDKMTKSIIEKSQVKNSFGKITRIQREGDLVVDENLNARICLDIDIQHEHLQKKHIPKSNFSNKVYGREEINKVLAATYALFSTIKLKKKWRRRHQYLKFMRVISNKMKKKDCVLFVSYMSP